jgi:hypothetical protein
VLSSPVWRGTPTLAFGAGLLAGGTLTAAGALVAGSLLRPALPQPARVALVAGVLAAVLARDLGLLRFPLPQRRRLVPETVFRLGRHLGPLQFGLEMGTGARTYLPSGLPYAALAAAALLATVPGALATGAGFGAGRWLMTVAALRYGHEQAWAAQWQRYARPLLLTCGAVLAVLLGAGR